ncbi:MAG: biotin--[acetyl-CoA-carboxylase] ligase [Archaeoglobi archaeon]|nr:MAG: biotin--[acetyl-CoA-carboxylase] ligase [Archaeoglobi archaeon]
MQELSSGVKIKREEVGTGKAFEFASITFKNLPFVENFYYYELTDSTNERARDCETFSLILAEEQTKGRGRLNRDWISKRGGLYFSIVLPPYSLEKLTLVSALSVAEAIEHSRIKWPNDVLLFGKKFCGILGESFGDKVIVGVGINVENDVEIPNACKISSFYRMSRTEVFDRVTARFGKNYLELLSGNWKELFAKYRDLCDTLGKKVRVITSEGIFEGVAEICEDGAIIVGGKKIYAGDCIHLR